MVLEASNVNLYEVFAVTVRAGHESNAERRNENMNVKYYFLFNFELLLL